jgi:YegS/Rv2252/BmrU family lipid kinase
LQNLGIEYEIRYTECPGHAIDLAEEAAHDGFDVVVAVGGDGTVNEVLNGLMRAAQHAGTESAMGVISVGRGNDFAFGANVPLSLEDACSALAGGKKKWIDIGYVEGGDYPEGRYFGNGIGIGFDAVVGFEALKLKFLSGFPSYIVAALKTISLYFTAPTLSMEYNGTTITQPTLMISVMNGRRMGGGFMMAPESTIDDGLFDLCIAGQVSRAGIFGLIPRFMKGTQAGHPAIRTARTDRVAITAVKGNLPARGQRTCALPVKGWWRILPKAWVIVTQSSAAMMLAHWRSSTIRG